MEYHINKKGYQVANFYYKFSRFKEPDYEEITLKICSKNYDKIKNLGRYNLEKAKIVFGRNTVALAYKDGENLTVILEENE